MLKKIFKILLVLIVLTALALGAFWFFNHRNNATSDSFLSNISVGNFFPFGQGTVETPVTPIETNNPTNPDTTSSPGIPVLPPALWQISNQPQSGAIAFNASGTPTVRYIDKATGNTFEGALRILGVKRITNTTIPKVYEALWQPNGNALVLRFLINKDETIRSTFGKLSTKSASSTPAGEETFRELAVSFLADNITSLSVDPSSGAIAYVSKNPTGSRIYVASSNATNPKQIFESQINDLSISWVNSTTLAVLSKPSKDTIGQFYFLKTDSGKLERVLGGQNGLMALAQADANTVVYSWTSGTSIQSALFNKKTGERNALRFAVIPEKCVFSNKSTNLYCAAPKAMQSNNLPDDWYQGRITFNDSFWRINTTTGAADLITDPKVAAGTEVDATNLMLDPNEEHLIFTNKKDSALWGLRIGAGN